MANLAIFLLTVGLISRVASDVGYRYNVPVTSYDVPVGSVGNLNHERKYYHVENQQRTGSLPVAPSPQLQTPINGHVSSHVTTSAPIDKLASFNLVDTQSKDSISGSQSVSLDGRLNAPIPNLDSSGVSSSNIDANFGQSSQVDVERHLYFFAAPEEPEDVRPRILSPQLPAKKSVKILFIKAPTFSSAPISIPSLPQNEEKTLVYVLVKKPDDSSIVVPSAAPVKPTKPEVYFIRYKSQKEAQDAIANLRQNGDASSVGGVSAIDSDSFGVDSRGQDYGGYGGGGGGSADYNENAINIASKYSEGIRKTVSEAPTLASTPVYGAAGLNVQDGSSGLTAQRTYSSDGISNFGGFPDGSAGSTTVSSVNLPTVSSKISEINVKQEYLPPRYARF